MKLFLLSGLIAILLCHSLGAQPLPTRSVTLYKNGRSLITKSGRVTANNGRYAFPNLPDPLFGTFWVTSASGNLASVVSRRDSVANPDGLPVNHLALLRAGAGQTVRLWVSSGWNQPETAVDGVVEKVVQTADQYTAVTIRTAGGKWIMVPFPEIRRIEFSEQPRWEKVAAKKLVSQLEVVFKNKSAEQEIGLTYLTDSVGWLPVYRLDLNPKSKSTLALRAEIANDAEDLGDAELRLAVGIPNFSQANGPDWLTDFYALWMLPGSRSGYSPAYSQQLQYQNSLSYSNSNSELSQPSNGAGEENFEAGKAEDFYFYTVRPGPLPRYSRYQFPVFETTVEPVHFFETNLPAAGPGSLSTSYQPRPETPTPTQPVFHYLDFLNSTDFPWTTGPVNVLSKDGETVYPISQDLLPYTAPGARCKIRIAQTPDIRVNHGEADIERSENVKKYFRESYDLVKVQGEISVINRRAETVKLRICRQVEGQPLKSDVEWRLEREQATLRVNGRYEVVWEIDLKPGEEKKWAYTYEVFVNL